MSHITFIMKRSKKIGLLLLLGIALQLYFVKPRWQFYPLYLVAALYFILMALNHFNILVISRKWSKRILLFAALLVVTSVLLILILPMEKLEIPGGPYKVGTRTYDVEDEMRDEVYTSAQGDYRRIRYQVWYPTDETEGYEISPWISDGTILTRQLAKSFYFPPFMLDHTAQIKSNSFIHAPLSSDKETYPVVVLSHGWLGFRELHTDLAEELASQGFIAVSIDHTYGSQAVKFYDGTVAYLNKNALPPESDVDKFNNSSNLLVKTYGEDVATVLDDLERLNERDQDFRARLDLSSIGVLGHSTGGGGDVFIALKDSRIKALVGLDAWVNPLEVDLLKQGLTIPTLFLRSEEWSDSPNNFDLNTLIKNSEDAALVQINRTTHVDFSMAYMYSPISKYIGFSGKMDGRQSIEIQKELVLDFFQYNLQTQKDSKESKLEEILEKYKDLERIN